MFDIIYKFKYTFLVKNNFFHIIGKLYEVFLSKQASELAKNDKKQQNSALQHNGNALMAVFPTASAGEVITLYDATGRVVATQAIRTGATTATIDTTALSAGVYIARLNNGATAKVAL